jgi:threonine/homoserine/homoserine lactone efflux protein
MAFIYVFFLTFSVAALGVIPPGMLNLKIAQISTKHTVKKAIQFIIGVVVVVSLQSLIGFYGSTFLNNHPDFTKNLKLIGCCVFVVLTLYFFGKGVQDYRLQQKNIEITEKKVSSYYLNGFLLSAINVFPIPYYGFFSLYFSSFITNFFSVSNGISFVLGASFGTGFIYYLYAKLFYNHQNKTQFFIKNINFIIGFITLLVSCFTFYKI